MDEERIDRSHFDGKSTEFQSSEPGRIIKSPRKFGIEVEMVSRTTEAINELRGSISSSFGFDRDGSIQADRGSTGVEVISPIMSGLAGESEVKKLFGRINALEFETNTTCGLHTHLDGEGFKNTRNIKVMYLSSCTDSIIKKVGRSDSVFLVNNKIFDNILSKTGMGRDELAHVLLDEFATRQRVLYLGKALGVHVPDIRVRRSDVSVGSRWLTLDYFDSTTPISISEKDVIPLSSLEPQPNDYLCIVKTNNALRNVKTLLYVYSVFSDVFMAMLPKSRRNNVYAQNLALSFSPNQIEALGSYTELETSWYKTRDMMETESRKGNHYDDSRYYGVNLHSLFSKYGTVEFRSHSATLSSAKALYWIALNQEILDGIASGEVTIPRLRPAVFMSTLDEKVNFFTDVLDLRTALKKYIQQRINYFSSNIK